MKIDCFAAAPVETTFGDSPRFQLDAKKRGVRCRNLDRVKVKVKDKDRVKVRDRDRDKDKDRASPEPRMPEAEVARFCPPHW